MPSPKSTARLHDVPIEILIQYLLHHPLHAGNRPAHEWVWSMAPRPEININAVKRPYIDNAQKAVVFYPA